MPTKRIIVSLLIHVFDRRKPNPLPYGRKQRFLDWNLVPVSRRDELLAMLEAEGRQDAAPRPQGAETVITMSCAPRHGSDPRVIQFRPYFVERTAEDVDREMHEPGADLIAFRTVGFVPDYIEDELGNRLTEHDVMDHMMGGRALILGNSESVLRIGPVPAKELGAWEQRHSDLVHQFLRVVERIHASDWSKSRVSISYRQDAKGGGDIIHRLFPSHSDVEAVLAWFRQLYSSDELFTRAVNVYLRHVDDHGKHCWVSRVREHFKDLRKSKPALTPIDGYTRAQLIDLIAYGTRVLHHQSDYDAETLLADLIAKYGDAELGMAVNASMWDLLGQASLAYHPMKQDFSHWVATGAVLPPRSVDLSQILKSDR
jgi:hypothetical protein